MNKTKISLCMIVKDEESCLQRCLSSAADFVDEIVVVDTGSVDATKQIARQFTSKIYDFAWEDDFSKARNFAFSKAEGDYILWLDADDFISPDNMEKLKKLKEQMNGSVDVYMLKYEIDFNEQNESIFTYFRERILKNDGTFFWQGAVHEVVTPHGKIEYCDIAIKHLKLTHNSSKRNLRIYQALQKKGKVFSAREQYYYSRELYYNRQYKTAITAINKLLKMQDVWLEDRLGALEIKALCQLTLNQPEKALSTLYQSFSLAPPRANFLCLVGDILLSQNKTKQCLFWYESALNCTKNLQDGGFVNENYFGVHPALQLCVAHFRLGNLDLSKHFNNLALNFNPNSSAALGNKKFFEDK